MTILLLNINQSDVVFYLTNATSWHTIYFIIPHHVAKKANIALRYELCSFHYYYVMIKTFVLQQSFSRLGIVQTLRDLLSALGLSKTLHKVCVMG